MAQRGNSCTRLTDHRDLEECPGITTLTGVLPWATPPGRSGYRGCVVQDAASRESLSSMRQALGSCTT